MEEVPREANRDFRELSFRPTAFAGMAPYQSGDVLKVDGNRAVCRYKPGLKMEVLESDRQDEVKAWAVDMSFSIGKGAERKGSTLDSSCLISPAPIPLQGNTQAFVTEV